MCSGRGTPGKRTTGNGNTGSSTTPFTLSNPSLMLRLNWARVSRSKFEIRRSRIIADGAAEVSLGVAYSARIKKSGPNSAKGTRRWGLETPSDEVGIISGALSEHLRVGSVQFK